METFSHHLKDRENKLYSSKAEFHTEYMKSHTSTPKIDPLSRRMAELITKRELEVLGIKPTESHSKKFFTIPPKAEESLIAAPKPPSQNSENAISAPNPDLKITVLVPESEGPASPLIQAEDLKTVKDQIEQMEYKRQKTQEMIVNLEGLKAFKDELHRDYPELGLNNSVEGSSFHTNELKELEDACKEMCTEQSENKAKAQNRIDSSEALLNSPDLETNTKTEPADSKPSDSKPEPGLKNRPPELKDTLSPNLSNIKIDLTPSHSKFSSLQSELPIQDFLNLQTSFIKASFLHTPQVSISNSVPRCHVDLLSCKTTPIYYNSNVAPGQKVMTSNGLGPADSMRYSILNQTLPVEKPEPKDTYSKNLRWLKNKKEREKKMRESLDFCEMQKCTFNPFGGKRKGGSEVFESKFMSMTPRASIEFKKEFKEFKDSSLSSIRPKQNLIMYTGLSPANAKVGYSAGCDVNKLIEKSQPMVDYKKINNLD